MTQLKTGELAERAGVHVESLRFYEREGLLPDPPRRASGYRRYPREAVGRVRFIKRAQELGFSLAEIRELLAIGTDPNGTCGEVKAHVEAKIGTVREKIATLERIERALRDLAERCPEYASSAACPILKALELNMGETEGEADDGE